MSQFLKQHWFLVVLVLVLAIGFWFYEPLAVLQDAAWIKYVVVTVTMFLLTWPTPLGTIARQVRRPGGVLLAFSVNLIVIPLVAWPLSKLIGPELGPGLIVLAATPSTLASAAVWTRRAGGNEIVCIVNTILTNGLCFLILPAWVWLLYGATPGELSFQDTMLLLLYLVVCPMIVSQLARVHQPSARWASAQKNMLGIVAQTGILVMVLLGAIQAGEKMQASQSAPALGLVVGMIGVAAALHIAAWWLGFRGGRLLGMDRADCIAIGFSGSQKTLMIGLTTAVQLQLSILPLVSYHMLQLVIDTVIADRLRKNSGPPADEPLSVQA